MTAVEILACQLAARFGFFLQTRFAVEFISQDFCRDLHGAHFFLSNGAWLVALSLCFQAGRDLIYLETFCHHRQ